MSLVTSPGAVSAVAPRLPLAKLWLDPWDTSTQTYLPYTRIVSASSQYLSTPGLTSNDPFNFQTNGTGSQSIFTVAGWFYYEAAPTTNTSLFGKCKNDLSLISWSLFSNSSAFDLDLFWGNSSGVSSGHCSWTSALQDAGNNVMWGQWIHVALVYDGSVPSANLYINGVKATVSGSTPPAQVGNPLNVASLFSIGNNYTNKPSLRTMQVGVWSNVAANQTQITALYNSGNPINVQSNGDLSKLPSGLTTPMRYWPMGDSGSPVDVSGNGGNLTGSGTPTTGQQLMSWTDKIGGLVFKPQWRVGNTNSFYSMLTSSPVYDPNGFSTGVPGLRFPAPSVASATAASNCFLYCPTTNFNQATGSIWINELITGMTNPGAGFETFEFAVGNDLIDASDNNKNVYFMSGISQVGSNTNWSAEFRTRMANNTINNDVDCFGASVGTMASGSTALTNSHTYSKELSFVDTSALSANSTSVGGCRIFLSDNGGAWVQQTLYNRNPSWNGGLFSYAQGTYASVGGGPARYNPAGDGKWGPPTNGSTAAASLVLGDIVVAGPVQNASQRLWMRAWMQNRLLRQSPQ